MRSILVVGSDVEARATQRFLWLSGAADFWSVILPKDLKPSIADSRVAFLGTSNHLLWRWQPLVLRMLGRRTACWTVNPLRNMINAVLSPRPLRPGCGDLTLLAADQRLHDWKNNVPRDYRKACVELEEIFCDILDPLIELGAIVSDQATTIRKSCVARTEGTRWKRVMVDEVQHIRNILKQDLR